MKSSFLFTLLIIATIFSRSAIAESTIQNVNYYASLRASETNVRAGPGQSYPVKFTFKLRGMPVRVVSEYDNWSEIEDFENQTGWVMQSLLTKKRNLMVTTKKSFINLYGKNNDKSRVLLRLENHVIGEFITCADDWCGMKVDNKKGWVQKIDIYGWDE